MKKVLMCRGVERFYMSKVGWGEKFVPDLRR